MGLLERHHWQASCSVDEARRSKLQCTVYHCIMQHTHFIASTVLLDFMVLLEHCNMWRTDTNWTTLTTACFRWNIQFIHPHNSSQLMPGLVTLSCLTSRMVSSRYGKHHTKTNCYCHTYINNVQLRAGYASTPRAYATKTCFLIIASNI